MTKFFMQHVGEALSKRDFPKSIGSRNTGLVEFSLDDLQSHANEPLQLSGNSLNRIKEVNSFQVWGLPEGAKSFTDQMFAGDYIMLLGSESSCEYIGRIEARIPRLCQDISFSIWGEQKFPWIICLTESAFIDLEWSGFLKKVGYATNYALRGNTSRVSDTKLAQANISADKLAGWVREFRV